MATTSTAMSQQQRSKRQSELFWGRVVLRKWLNISAKESDYSADTEDDYDDADSGSGSDSEDFNQWERGSRLRASSTNEAQAGSNDAFPMLRRRKSETFRAQYINTKEIKLCAATWNVAGKIPPEDLDIDEWINVNDPADIYVLGFQEIIPLNAGNIFGAEDKRPIPIWENIIRETLNRVQPARTKVKCYSDPPSPSKFKLSDDIPDVEEEILLETDSDRDAIVHAIDEETDSFTDEIPLISKSDSSMAESSAYIDSGNHVKGEKDYLRQLSSPKRVDRLNCVKNEDITESTEVPMAHKKLMKMLSGSERIGLTWPDPPLNLIPQHVLETPPFFKSIKSFEASKSFRTYNSFKYLGNKVPSDLALLGEIDLESLLKRRRRRSPFVRIVSKQMVGIFLTVWVRRSLRRHIQNVKISTVGVGVMGYIGNKGSISLSMSIYQTFFCFICSHLTHGERDGDELKRNSNVHDIHRRTLFRTASGIRVPRGILDHEKIIWMGDLNYRINLSYERVRELISKKEWSKLIEKDQLVQELRKGRTFDGWSEGTLNFPPTYKYEVNSEKYYGEDPKIGRRNPAWCDRILSYGKGMKQLSYRRAELKLSDHRPVTATYMVEVEVFSPKKLQRALTFTDAEIENEDAVTTVGIDTSEWKIEGNTRRMKIK